jgi:integration host factor subunit beta
LGSLCSDYAELHAVTKSELIDKIAENLKLPAGKAEAIVNCVFDSMVKALEVGEGIEIRGFGSFTVREYKSYEGRNPRTGAPVHVPPKRLPFFKVLIAALCDQPEPAAAIAAGLRITPARWSRRRRRRPPSRPRPAHPRPRYSR